MLPDDITLPTHEELDRQEIPLTYNYFVSSAMWLGKYCDHQCKEFMLCRQEEADPRKCLKYGHEVTDCGMEFFKKVKKSCREELEWYTKCLDFSGREQEFHRCRREQAIFDGCMFDHGFERAKFGHFNLLRVHESERPMPKPLIPVFPDAVQSFDIYDPENRKKGTGGVGTKYFWEVWFDN